MNTDNDMVDESWQRHITAAEHLGVDPWELRVEELHAGAGRALTVDVGGRAYVHRDAQGRELVRRPFGWLYDDTKAVAA